MGLPCFVFHHIHPVVGCDFENCITPPAPTVIPFTPYATATILSGNYVQAKFTTKSFALMQGIRIMQRDTNCGMLGVPHFGFPGNALYPLILTLTAKSKSTFGSSSTQLEGASVAIALAFVGVNLQCGTVSTPTGLVIPPTTVFAGMSLGDFVAGVFSIAFEVVLDLIFNKLGQTTGMENGMNSLAARVIGRVWATRLSRVLPDSLLASHAAIRSLIEELFKMGAQSWGDIGTGVATGQPTTPVGPAEALEKIVRRQPWWQRNMES